MKERFVVTFLTLSAVILFEITALTDIKIVSFEDIGRGKDLTSEEEETQIVEKAHNDNDNDSLKEHIKLNRLKAMKIAREIEKQKELKSERKAIDDAKFSGETYDKFIKHINRIKVAAAEIALATTKVNKPTLTQRTRKDETKELSDIEHSIEIYNEAYSSKLFTIKEKTKEKSKKQTTATKSFTKTFEKEKKAKEVSRKKYTADSSADEDALPILPNVKYESFNLSVTAPSRTIPDTKFVTTTQRQTTRYKTDIPTSVQKRKYKKYNADKGEKTKSTVKKINSKSRRNRKEYQKMNKTTKKVPVTKRMAEKIVWQAASISNESSLEM